MKHNADEGTRGALNYVHDHHPGKHRGTVHSPSLYMEAFSNPPWRFWYRRKGSIVVVAISSTDCSSFPVTDLSTVIVGVVKLCYTLYIEPTLSIVQGVRKMKCMTVGGLSRIYNKSTMLKKYGDRLDGNNDTLHIDSSTLYTEPAPRAPKPAPGHRVLKSRVTKSTTLRGTCKTCTKLQMALARSACRRASPASSNPEHHMALESRARSRSFSRGKV